MVCGATIGYGAFREVFEYNLRPPGTAVIKVEQKQGMFENVLEFEVWDKVKNTEFAKWFAPCRRISHSGTWLVQDRTKPLTEKQLPDKVPSFFTDIKRANMGWYKGHPVFHDYGRNLLMERGMTKRMQKIDWTIYD